jgi:CRISPR-associated protein Csh2
MSEIVKNRSEILFIYDVTDANPNGDPVEENKPRIDEEAGVNIVTDVRLKRTIRDYLYNFRNQEIFVREIRDEDGYLQDAKLRAEDFLVDETGKKIDKGSLSSVQEMENIVRTNILKTCLDVRLFGATIPVELDRKGGSVTLTGPVQFKMGRSLHKVDITFIKGTGAFASAPKKEQFTFREEYILPYSLISFYGIVNENAARSTQLTEADVELLLEGIWNGTKNLISRSKVGQVPRLLLQVVYKENDFHIGELDRLLNLVNAQKRDEEIRDISEVRLDVTKLAQKLEENKEKIDKIRYAMDNRLILLREGEQITTLGNLVPKVNCEILEF